MTSKKTWFITGAGRGMGVEFTKAALVAGHNVVATGRGQARRTPAADRRLQRAVASLALDEAQTAAATS